MCLSSTTISENPATIGSASSGGGQGKAKLDDFTIQEPVGTYSIQYFNSLTSGGHYNQIAINVRRTFNGTTTTYLTYLLGTVYITKQEQSDTSGSNGGPTETITMTYGSINLSYREQNQDGTFQQPTSQCFSEILNNSSCP